MKKQENYMVYIPATDTSYARPVRIAEDVMRQIRALTSPAVVPYCIGEGYVMHCVVSVPGATDGILNFPATVLLGERGKSAYGDVVICRIAEDDYKFFTKDAAREIAGIINLI